MNKRKIIGIAALVAAAGTYVVGAAAHPQRQDVGERVFDPCGMSIVAVDFDDTGFDCNPQAGQRVDVHYRDVHYQPAMQEQCDLVGGSLVLWGTGEWVCEDVDF